MGKPVAVDLDDAYHILPWCNPAHKYWLEKNDGAALGKLEMGLAMCDGLIAPNRLLLSDWKHVTRGYFLNNYSEKDWWKNLDSREKIKEELGIADKIVIGWGGSVSHYDSWHGSGIFDAAKAICDEFPNVLWMICGNDDRIYHHLPVPVRQKKHQPGVPPNQWPRIVKSFDVGVAPLYGPYDQRRSWIKGIEYLHAGVPWVGTIGEPYSELSNLGILIENGAENWERTIRGLIKNLDKNHEIAEERIEASRELHADNQIDTIIKVFKKIIRDFKDEKSILPGVIYVSPE